MSILNQNDTNEEDIDGCTEALMQKAGSLMKRNSKKYSHRSNLMSSKNMMMQLDKSDSVMPQKTYIFWILIFIILFMAGVNFLLLVIMMNVLNIGEGMESMEMVTNDDIVKFFGEIDFDNVVYDKGVLKGFQNMPLHVSGNEGPVLMSIRRADDLSSIEKLRVDDTGVIISEINQFDVVDPISGTNVFSTAYKDFVIPKGVLHLNVKKLRVNNLISPSDSNLTVKPDTGVTRLRGNKGVIIQGKEILFRADGDVNLNSVNGNIHFLAEKIKINNMPHSSGSRSFMNSYQNTKRYKLCVCMPQGVLFQVLVPKNADSHKACSYVDLSPGKNPCVQF